MPEDLIAEEKFCLLLARGSFTPDVAKRAVDRLETGLRWDVVLERATAHGLVPLVYNRLCALEFSGVPAAIRRRLTDTFGVNAIRNILLAQELVSVLTQLGAAGVPVIPLKGTPLAESLYGDPALRISADLDILVQPKHLADSLRLLARSGYTVRGGDSPLVGLLARYGKDCALTREVRQTAYPLQIHCGLIWGGPAERSLLAEIWADATPRPFHAAPAYALSPEWEFLYLAIHAARHGLCPFKWLVDLDWVCVRGAVDWEKVQATAKRLGWQDPIDRCLTACAALLETPVPEPFLRRAPRARPRIRVSHPGPLQTHWETLFSLRLLPSFSRRFQFLATRLFVPTAADCDLLPLPSSLFFLYYVLRPMRLAGAAVRSLIQASIAKLRRRRTTRVLPVWNNDDIRLPF